MALEISTSGPEETLALGQELAIELAPGDIVLLEGPLGAGKTLLTQGIVRGLGGENAPVVTSQSYVIAGEYPTDPPVNHLDLYRLTTTQEVIALGYEELIYSEVGLSVVEWPELLIPLLDEDDLVITINFAHGTGEEQRLLKMSSAHHRLEQAFRRAAERAHLAETPQGLSKNKSIS